MSEKNNNNSEKKWIVVTSDEEMIETAAEVMKMFGSLELECYDGEIGLDITGEQMKFIIQYTTLYLEHGSVRDNKQLHNLEDWEKELISGMNQEKLFQMMLIANRFHIKPLLDVTCCYVASLIKGKTPEELRQQFTIPK